MGDSPSATRPVNASCLISGKGWSIGSVSACSATPTPGGERSLPRLTGNALVRSFDYRRPVTMTAELQVLGHRGKRTRRGSTDTGGTISTCFCRGTTRLAISCDIGDRYNRSESSWYEERDWASAGRR
jgi:hypothetical protein